MTFSKEEIEKIKKIFEKAYAELEKYYQSPEHRDIPKGSLLDAVYNHTYTSASKPPKNIRESLHRQLSGTSGGSEMIRASLDHLNSMLKSLLEKQKVSTLSRVEGILRDYNSGSKHSPDLKGRVSEVKRRLRDYSQDANRDWSRIASTEISNAVGMASIDRIAEENKDKDFTEVYVYRIVVNDAALCKWCKKFYLDSDGTPAVYRLSELIANNSNYGKKTDEWRPVAGATHPNERCSPTIELRPGFKILPGGAQTFVGLKDWNNYVKSKVR